MYTGYILNSPHSKLVVRTSVKMIYFYTQPELLM